MDSSDSILNASVEDVAVLAEVRMGADSVKMMEGAWKGRDMLEGAEQTGGEGGGDCVGTVWLSGKGEVVMFCMVFWGYLEETSVTEGAKMVNELGARRVSEGASRVMKVGVVVRNPARREESMFSCNMLTEGMMEVFGGVRCDGVV